MLTVRATLYMRPAHPCVQVYQAARAPDKGDMLTMNAVSAVRGVELGALVAALPRMAALEAQASSTQLGSRMCSASLTTMAAASCASPAVRATASAPAWARTAGAAAVHATSSMRGFAASAAPSEEDDQAKARAFREKHK